MSEFDKTLFLKRSGGNDSIPNRFGTFASFDMCQIPRADRGNFNMHVNPIQQRAGNFGLIFRCAKRCSGAFLFFGAEIAAAAGVHGGNQLKSGRKSRMGMNTGNADAAILQRLAESLKCGAAELGEFVQKQNAVMSQRYFSGLAFASAADQSRRRRSVMRVTIRPVKANPSVFQNAGNGVNHTGFQGFFRT